MANPTYSISLDGKSITCYQCGLTSHNINDVINRYCGNCNIFHKSWTLKVIKLFSSKKKPGSK